MIAHARSPQGAADQCPRCASRGLVRVESIGDCTETVYVCGHQITTGPPLDPVRRDLPRAPSREERAVEWAGQRAERKRKIHVVLKSYARAIGAQVTDLERLPGTKLSVMCPIVGKAKRRG